VNYILMHGKTDVVELLINEKSAEVMQIGRVFNLEHLPIGITIRNGLPDMEDMDDWWRGRSIPASRQDFKKAMEHLQVSSSVELITKCLGLSLSDQYWINPISSPLKWEDVNFFDNTFSEDVGNALFQQIIKNNVLNLKSPDNTSDGLLKKKWKIIDGKRYLIKGGTDPYQQEPFNEAFSSVIMERLHINHAKYSIIWEDNLPYSVCENFITSDTELINAFYIHNTKRIDDASNFCRHYLECCMALGIPNAREDFDKMIVLDFLIANRDRHMGNFGAVRNANTLEWIELAPIYDCGTSLWYNQLPININPERTPCSIPFLDTHEEQIKAVNDFSWLDLPALNNIEDAFMDIYKGTPFIDVDRRDALCHAIRKRVEMLMYILTAATCP